MNNFTYVGLDDGHHSVKVVTEKGKFTFASRAKQGRHVINTRETNVGMYETEEGLTFTVNAHITDPKDTRFAEYPASQLNRVLVHHGLMKAGMGGKKVVLATGLPFDHYYINGEKNKALIAKKMQNLALGVSAQGADMAKIIHNMVTTEGIAAYMDQLMDMNGVETKECDRLKSIKVGVIDIGGHTTDVAVVMPMDQIDDGEVIDISRSGSVNSGMLQLNDSLAKEIIAKFKLSYLSPMDVERAIRTNEIDMDGATHDLTDTIIEHKKAVMSSIQDGISNLIGTGRELGRIIIVGGGSIVLKDELKAIYPNAIFAEDPEFANARGMYKIARFVSNYGG